VLNALRYQQPQDELEAKFSIPFSLAILLLERRAGIAQYTTEVVRQTRVQEMMTRVRGYLHEEIESRGFERIRSLIEVRLRDGRVLTKEAHTSRGTPDRPMTGDELAGKFRECSQDVIPPRNADSFLDMAWRLENVNDIKSLTGLLQDNPG
jgi:2-methylcitrate dehydratase PrpD